MAEAHPSTNISLPGSLTETALVFETPETPQSNTAMAVPDSDLSARTVDPRQGSLKYREPSGKTQLTPQPAWSPKQSCMAQCTSLKAGTQNTLVDPPPRRGREHRLPPTNRPPPLANTAHALLRASKPQAHDFINMTAGQSTAGTPPSPCTPPMWSGAASPSIQALSPAGSPSPRPTEPVDHVHWDMTSIVGPSLPEADLVQGRSLSIPAARLRQPAALLTRNLAQPSWLQGVIGAIQGNNEESTVSMSSNTSRASSWGDSTGASSTGSSSDSESAHADDAGLLQAAFTGNMQQSRVVPPLNLEVLSASVDPVARQGRTRESHQTRRRAPHHQALVESSSSAESSPKGRRNARRSKQAPAIKHQGVCTARRSAKEKEDYFAQAYSASHTTDDDLTNMALYLGIEPSQEKQLLWIAEEALHAPLPQGWHMEQIGVSLKTEAKAAGLGGKRRTQYFFHSDDPQATQWEHPLDEFYRSLVRETRCSSAASSKVRGGKLRAFHSDTSSVSSSDSKLTENSDSSHETAEVLSAGNILHALVSTTSNLVRSMSSATAIFQLVSPRSAQVQPQAGGSPTILPAAADSNSVNQAVKHAPNSSMVRGADKVQSTNKLEEIQSALQAEYNSEDKDGALASFPVHLRPWGLALAVQASHETGIAVSYAKAKYRVASDAVWDNRLPSCPPVATSLENAKLCIAAAAVLPTCMADIQAASRYLGIPLAKIAAFESAWVCKALLLARSPAGCKLVDEDERLHDWAIERMRGAVASQFSPSRESPCFTGDVSLVVAHSLKTMRRHPLDAAWKSLALVPWSACSVRFDDSSDEDSSQEMDEAQTAGVCPAYTKGRRSILTGFPDFSAAEELSIKQVCNSNNYLRESSIEIKNDNTSHINALGGVAESKGEQQGFAWETGEADDAVRVPAPGTEPAALAINAGVKDACKHFTSATWSAMQDGAAAFYVRAGLQNAPSAEQQHQGRFASASSRPLQLFSREALLTMTEDELVSCLGAVVAMVDRQGVERQHVQQSISQLQEDIASKEAAIARAIATASAPEQ